jgi:putative hemolysin
MSRQPDVLSFKLSSKRLSPGVAKRIRQLLGSLSGFSEFNRIYAGLGPCDAAGLSGLFIDALKVRIEPEGHYPDAVPKDGPLVIVANHPFGLIEGMAIDAMLQAVRPDSTVMVVHWLAQIPEVRDRAIFVAPRQAGSRRGRSVSGWREAIGWLRNRHALALFPGSNVARFRWSKGAVAELEWSAHVASAILKTRARTIPVYFPGRNSRLFQIVSMICPPLINFLLMREFLNKRGHTVKAIWGKIIEPDELSAFFTHDEMITHLKQRVEELGVNQRPIGVSL